MKKRVITISREFGSGGRVIGKMVAEKLGYTFYDRDLVRMVAKEKGYDLEFVEETGEYSASGLFRNLTIGNAYGQAYSQANLSIQDQIFILQTQLIKEIANEGNCVIVGRSADYILKEREDCLNIFIHADYEHKKERVLSLGYKEKEAKKIMQKRDKARANHHKYYSDQVWGMAQNYHICLDSGALGYSACSEIIIKAIDAE